MYEGYPPRGFSAAALGAYVLSQDRTKVSSSLSSADDASMQNKPHTLRINQSSLLTPPAVINHQAEQIANARRRAAEGSLAPYTIPLLANTQTRSSKNRVTWTLKFALPAPADEGTTRRFSAVPRGYGPSGAPALEGAVHYAYPFDYQPFHLFSYTAPHWTHKIVVEVRHSGKFHGRNKGIKRWRKEEEKDEDEEV